MVANNDYAIGKLMDAVSHSKYWPSTAIFIIEDDALDGPNHVYARRTVGLVISPYVKRGIVDSTFAMLPVDSGRYEKLASEWPPQLTVPGSSRSREMFLTRACANTQRDCLQ